MPEYIPPADTARLSTHLPLKAESSHTEDLPVEDASVSIPVTDVEVPEYAEHVRQAIFERQRLQSEVNRTQEVWSRASEKQIGESDQDHQQRIKAEFEAAVMAVRRQDAQPAPPPQPVPRQIADQTRREMEAGRKQSAYWEAQKVNRPLPTAKEIREAGTNTPVFRPGEYMHEKGGLEKNLVTQNQPVR